MNEIMPRARGDGAALAGASLALGLLVAALLLTVTSLAGAQTGGSKSPKAFMVEDIYPGPTSSEPNHLTDLKGTLLFGAYDPRFGEELWKSNGTAANTDIIKDLDPGSLVINNVEQPNSSAPDKVMSTKKWIYFAATTGAKGEELFRSDGTAAGTDIVRDIVPGPGSSGAEEFEPVDSKTTIFRAFDEAHGEELWKTDGTAAGTTLVKDINLDPEPGGRCPQNQCGIPMGWSHPDTLTAMGKTVFFAADDGVHGVELWKTDGTAAGTTLVKDINTVPGNSNPNDSNGAETQSAEVEKLFPVGKTLYFRANDGVSGVELWKTDGTAAGTVRVEDINPASPRPTTAACKRQKSCAGSSFVDDFALAKGQVLFTANDGVHGVELWKTDGTEAGTALVKDTNPSSAARASGMTELIVAKDELFFKADDGTHGLELWKSDGTPNGTVLVEDINPAGASAPDQLTNFKGRLLFTANDGVSGTELWASDGTEAGTTLLLDVAPGELSSGPSGLTVSGNLLYFAATDPSTGEELWAVPTTGRTKIRP